MPLKTVYVRRQRPSALALLLALMLTMLFVYAVQRSADTGAVEQVSAQAHMKSEIRIDAFSAQFLIFAQTDSSFSARVEAASCAEKGGAGCIIGEEDRWYVISDAVQSAEADTLNLSAGGFTMEISGQKAQVDAIRDAIELLQTLATETTLGEGGVLIDVYRSQAKQICTALEDCNAARSVYAAVARTLDRLDTGDLRLIHTAAKLEWLDLMHELCR